MSDMYVHENSISDCARVSTHATIVVYEYRISHEATLRQDTAEIGICGNVEHDIISL